MLLKGINSTIIGPKLYFDNLNLNTQCVKYASFKFAKQTVDPSIMQIIEKAPITWSRNHVVVDVKVHDLEIQQVPAIPGWHIDCITHPQHPAREEIHHLFILGFNTTEFFSINTEVEVPPYPAMAAKFNVNVPVAKAPSNCYITYGRIPHRAPVTVVPERRLLIRVTETDVISPRNQIFEPYKCSIN